MRKKRGEGKRREEKKKAGLESIWARLGREIIRKGPKGASVRVSSRTHVSCGVIIAHAC